MLVIGAEIRIAEENMEAMADLCRTMVEETVKEPACITYAFSQDFSEPGLVRIFEAWESQEGLGILAGRAGGQHLWLMCHWWQGHGW